MAFGACIFIVAVIFSYSVAGAQSTEPTQPTLEVNLENYSSSQTQDDSASLSASTIVSFTVNSDRVYEKEYNSSFATDVPIIWNDATVSNKDIETEVGTVVFVPSASPLEPTNSALGSSEALLTYMTEKLETNTNDRPAHTFDASMSSTQAQKTDIDESANESDTTKDTNITITSKDTNITVTPEDTNIITFSAQWNNKNSSREPREFATDATDEQQEYQLILLKSNCSIVNSENIPLIEDLSDVGCTLHLRVNLSLDNGTRDKLLRTMEKLNIKPSEFKVVEMFNQNEGDASGQKQQDKHSGFVFDSESFAYLAVAIAFAFLLLLAVMVFGFRCFRKRRPTLDISRFDVRLSNYTLTKIPRASLSAMDSLHESDCMDDKPESSTMRNKDCESCESGLDIIPCDTYSSNREMKTFGVSRPSVSGINDSPTDMYPHHNPIAYENHTFQRYF